MVEYWTTKDGRKIDVDEMDIDHLRNTLKMIIRNRRIAAEADEIKWSQKQALKFEREENIWRHGGDN